MAGLKLDINFVAGWNPVVLQAGRGSATADGARRVSVPADLPGWLQSVSINQEDLLRDFGPWLSCRIVQIFHSKGDLRVNTI